MFDIVVGKQQPGSLVSEEIVVLNSVGQPACSADHGYGAISQAVHLIETARLVFRRHKKDVSAGFDQVSAAVIEFKTDAAFAGMTLNHRPEIAFRFFISAAEQHEMQIFREQVVQDADDKIETFLDINARNHPQKWPIELGCVEPKFLEQSSFVVELAGEVRWTICRTNESISFGIPELFVDSVQNTYEIIGSLFEETFKTIPEFCTFLDFTGVSWTDSRNEVGVRNTGLHKIDLSIKFKWTHGIKVCFGKICSLHNVESADALITNVLDCY